MASGRLFPALSGELRSATLLKKETLARVISYEFSEISKNTFFTEYLLATASVLSKMFVTFLGKILVPYLTGVAFQKCS